MLDLSQVNFRLHAIRGMAAAGEDEAAHQAEVELYREIVEVAAVGVDVADVADQALASRQIDFARWFDPVD